MSLREWLHKLVKGTGTVVTEPDTEKLRDDLKELDDQLANHTVKVRDLPPEVRADIDAETEEAIRDGRLIAGPMSTTGSTRDSLYNTTYTEAAQALAGKVDSEMLTPPPADTEEGYPVGDPKAARPVDWDAKPETDPPPLTEEALTEVKERLQEGGGGRDNRALLALVTAAEAVLKSNPMPEDSFSKPSEESDMTPHNDTLPQFIRPEVALRKLPPDAGGYRASTAFIRKVMELLRDVFPEVPDKLWILNETQDLESGSLIVSVLVRVKRDRDILVQIRPNSSRCMVRGAEDEPMLDDTTLDNARWDDFVGWVSLSKSLVAGA